MAGHRVHRFVVVDPHHGAVPCAGVTPEGTKGPLPLCLFLYGGGGSHETLVGIAPLLEAWWADGTLPPVVVATPDVGPWSFYLDDPGRGTRWESLVADTFVRDARERFDASAVLGAVGISMGGYGALKMAFARPSVFAAVAAVAPMVEPVHPHGAVPARNRFHYPPEVPAALLGTERDAALWESDHPAHRARRAADALRRSALALYLDAGSTDALHAHDGAEHLHRVLWSLDVAHEYRLRHDADHLGPTLVPRLRRAFRWVGEHLAPASPPPLTTDEQAWARWLEAGGDPPSVALAPTSSLMPRVLRAQLARARARAEERDPTTARRYGVLPGDPF